MIEGDDFASGTSSRSTKLIHGGVRYLQKAILGVRVDCNYYLFPFKIETIAFYLPTSMLFRISFHFLKKQFSKQIFYSNLIAG